MASLISDSSAAAKADYKSKLNGVGLSDKVRSVMGDIVDNQNVSTGADLVAALTKSKEFPEKVKGLNADEAAELDTHLLALLIEQHYKTQLMVDKLSTKLDGMDATLKLNGPSLDINAPSAPGGFLPKFLNPFGGVPSGPSVEVTAPDVKINVPSVNVSGPTVPAAPTAPSSAFPTFLNPFSAPKAPEVNLNVGVPGTRDIKIEGPEINGKMPTPFDGLKGPQVQGPSVNTPATPLLDWILGLNPSDKPAATLPMMIINVATTGVKATPTGIEHSYTVTAINATPDELKKLVDDAVASGAFTKTLKDAGFPNASATKPCTVADKTPTENPLKRTVVDVTQEIDKLTVADTNTPAFKSAIGGTVPRLAAALPSVPGLPGASVALPPPPMVILDFSLKSVTPEPADSSVTAMYSLTAINATPAQIAEVMDNAVACGAFDRALKSAGFHNAKAAGKVTVKDVSPEVNPLKKTVLEISQKVTGVTPEQADSPAFKASLGDAVVTAPSLSLNAPALDELPKVDVPMFDLDVLIPKFVMLSPVFGGGVDASAPVVPAAKLPMMIVNMQTTSITPLPANTGITHVYEVTAINCTAAELTNVINMAIAKGVMTQSLANAGFPNAVATKPVTERDVTPKDSMGGRIVVEYTQVLDKLTMADAQTPAFKSAVAGELPRMAFAAANPTLPAPPAPPVIISVVAKSVTPAPDGGVEVVYAVTAINTSKEGLMVVLDKAIRAGFFTQALKSSGYPNAEARQCVQVFDATPDPNPKKLTVLDVTQTVAGVTMEDANKPEFKMAFSNSVAMTPSVSPEMPELYPEVPTFDFSRLSGMFVAPSMPAFGGFGGEPTKPSLALDRSKFPFIIKVSTFSVGPLPFGNGIIHGFLVTAQHTNPTQLTEVINGAIKAGYFTKVFRDAGYATASATEPLDIADDMTSVYYPKENPLERTVLYCQHRIDNLKADDTKSLAFKSAFGWVVPQCADPDLASKLKDAKPIIIIDCVMNKVVESSTGRSCVADYTVTAINCTPEQLQTIVNNAVKQGVFTQALKDAGFNSAGATDFVTLKDSTPTPNPKGQTVCDVTQIVTGISPTEGNTPPFATAMGTAVATAPSCSSDPDLHAPNNSTFNFALPSLPDMTNVVPRVAFVLPAVFDDGLSHLDPETRKGNVGKASSLRQPDAASKDNKNAFTNMFGGDDGGLPKGAGSLKTEVLPKVRSQCNGYKDYPSHLALTAPIAIHGFTERGRPAGAPPGRGRSGR